MPRENPTAVSRLKKKSMHRAHAISVLRYWRSRQVCTRSRNEGGTGATLWGFEGVHRGGLPRGE
jgi:hypothetical protein